MRQLKVQIRAEVYKALDDQVSMQPHPLLCRHSDDYIWWVWSGKLAVEFSLAPRPHPLRGIYDDFRTVDSTL